MQTNKTRILSTTGLIFIGIIVGIVITANLEWTPISFAKKNNPELHLNENSPSNTLLSLQNTSKAFTTVSKEVLPTVVSISSTKIVKRRSSDEFFSPFFRDFFGRDNESSEPQEQRMQGLGSGVIVSDDGYILTNNHVIEGADELSVTLYDKRTFDAEIIGSDPLTDVAVIKIKGDEFHSARLGDSEKLEIGEWVLAIGSPLSQALSSTVTAGIVSARGRAIGIIQDRDRDSGGSYAIENFIQTDAAINPGNSGGALVNLNGEVIGINTAIASGTRYYMGYGFAIPINLARKIMKDLVGQGYVTRAWLGVGMNQVTEAVADRYNMDRPMGVLISQVMEDSPASKAGLKPLDILLEVDGREVNASNEVQSYIALKNPGDKVTLTVLRKGSKKNLKVELGQRDTGKENVAVEEDGDDEGISVGLTVRTLNDELRNQIEAYEDDEGVLITEVKAYSPAYDAGIQRGDLLYKIEDESIETKSEYRKILNSFDKGSVVIYYLKRRDTKFYAFVKLPKE